MMPLSCHYLLVLLALAHVARAATSSPSVKLGGTAVIGSTNSELGVDFFGGIPFAEAPVGKLRLKPPVVKKRLGGRTFDASKSGDGCLQPAANITGLSEDCLSLDIYRPAGVPSNAKLPVVVWLFGGGFTIGSASQYDGSNLVARSVARGTPVIYIAHNYRLSLLGFPQGQEADDSGILNLSLRDHLAALEWIKANIASFGGDSRKVTVFGQSSGSMIISTLMFNSPLHSLARAAIFESGFPNSLTALKASQWEATWQGFVSAIPSCAANATSGRTLSCLSKATTAELFDALNFVLAQGLQYGLTIDGPNGLLPAAPSQLISAGHFAKMPFIAGTNLDEGTVFVDTSSDLSQSGIRNTLVNIYGPPALPPSAINATVDKLLKLYPDIPSLGAPFNTGNETFGLPSGFKREAAILGDVTFDAPRRSLSQAAAKYGSSVYTYLLTQPQTDAPAFQGVTHGAELGYVYGTTSDSSALSKIVMDYWISYANSLTPNDGKGSSRPRWPQYTAKKSFVMELNSANLTAIPDTYRKPQIDFINANPLFFHQ